MILAVIVLTLTMTYFNGYLYLYIIQSEGYRNGFALTRSKKLILIDFTAFIVSLALLVTAWAAYADSSWRSMFYVLSYLPPLAVVVYKSARYFEARVKYTNRMWRLTAIYAAFTIIVTCIGFIQRSLLSALPLVIQFSLPIALVANAVALPFEKRNNQKYIERAKTALAKPQLIKIGITGSYGKTSVKEILKAILSKRYNTLVTPGNYNTPLGIARTVGGMDEKTQVFIAEMGARRKGDITELIEVVKPDIGILTGIAEQHSESFGSLDNILAEKRILIDNCRLGIINSANSTIRDRLSGEGLITVGFEGRATDAVCKISDCRCDKSGGSFTLSFRGRTLLLKTRLLGRHNILNIALAAAAAICLDVLSEDIIAAVEELEPLPHRQEKTVTEKGITIIDDSYNINPEGVRAALDTLGMFGGRKIVAVSGFVELADKEKEYNYLLGEWISETADIMVIIGDKYKKDIVSGALKNRAKCSIITVKNMSECKELYADILKKGDILLILADLPPYYLI